MLRYALMMSVLCALTVQACAGDDVVQAGDGLASMAEGADATLDTSEPLAASDTGSGDALESVDGGAADAGVDPCPAMRAQWRALFDEARACAVVEECTKPYLGYQPCSCTVFVGGEADLNGLFALDADLKDACIPAEAGCPAVECPQGVVSCDEGLCRTTFDG